MQTEEHVGRVKHYYPKAHAASVHIDKGNLHVGDVIHVRGPHTELEERIERMELDHEPIDWARQGQDVGIEMRLPVEDGAEVRLVHDPYDAEQGRLLDRLFGARW